MVSNVMIAMKKSSTHLLLAASAVTSLAISACDSKKSTQADDARATNDQAAQDAQSDS